MASGTYIVTVDWSRGHSFKVFFGGFRDSSKQRELEGSFLERFPQFKLERMSGSFEYKNKEGKSMAEPLGLAQGIINFVTAGRKSRCSLETTAGEEMGCWRNYVWTVVVEP